MPANSESKLSRRESVRRLLVSDEACDSFDQAIVLYIARRGYQQSPPDLVKNELGRIESLLTQAAEQIDRAHDGARDVLIAETFRRWGGSGQSLQQRVRELRDVVANALWRMPRRPGLAGRAAEHWLADDLARLLGLPPGSTAEPLPELLEIALREGGAPPELAADILEARRVDAVRRRRRSNKSASK